MPLAPVQLPEWASLLLQSYPALTDLLGQRSADPLEIQQHPELPWPAVGPTGWGQGPPWVAAPAAWRHLDLSGIGASLWVRQPDLRMETPLPGGSGSVSRRSPAL